MKKLGLIFKKTSGLIILFLYLWSGSPAYAEIEIFTPPRYIRINSDHIFIVGKATVPLVEIVLNGHAYSESQVIDSCFHAPVKFGYGLNEIIIKPMSVSEIEAINEQVTIEVLYEPSSQKDNLFYQKYYFHGSNDAKYCIRCHKEYIIDSGVDEESDKCLVCHSEYKERKSIMVVKEHQKCQSCHTVDTAHSTSLMGISKKADQCYNCHKDKINKFNQEYIHGPVAGGSCMTCHDPHGSIYDHSLKEAEETICFTCHNYNRELKEFPIQHQPFEQGKCYECHDPHATNNRWMLLRSSEVMCLKCHNSDTESFELHSHPYNVKPNKKLNNKLKLSRDGRIECISCHRPHASNSAHLLRSTQKNECLGCHMEKK